MSFSVNTLSFYRKQVDKIRSRYNTIRALAKQERVEVIEAIKMADAAVEAQKLLQEAAQATQSFIHAKIATIVTRCLKAVYGEEAYEFEITFERKRGKTEASFWFNRNGERVNPLNSAGGGPVDVAAFALRLACLVLTRPSPRRLLVLDEAFTGVDAKHAPVIANLITTLAQEFNFQIIMVTHNDNLRVGTVIDLDNLGG